MKYFTFLLGMTLLASAASAAEIEPTWESLAESYHVPDWFVDGKVGVWMHWEFLLLPTKTVQTTGRGMAAICMAEERRWPRPCPSGIPSGMGIHQNSVMRK